MSRYGNDSRVTERGNGGYTVTTDQGSYHVLESGAMGWGIYTGENLDLLFSAHGPVIGAADPNDLIAALLDHDNTDTETDENASAVTAFDDDTDGM